LAAGAFTSRRSHFTAPEHLRLYHRRAGAGRGQGHPSLAAATTAELWTLSCWPAAGSGARRGSV